MKSLISIFSLFFAMVVLGQEKTKIPLKNISRVDETCYTNGVLDWKNNIFYDKSGQIIKEVYTTKNKKKVEIMGTDLSVYESKYQDSFLIEYSEKNYLHNKLVDSSVTKYDYKFDDLNRIVSKQINYLNGRIELENYSYNKENQLEYVYVYKNDTLIFPNVHLLDKPTIKKIRKYIYEFQTLIIKECKYPNNFNECCNTFETFENDTVNIKIEKFCDTKQSIYNPPEVKYISKKYKKNGDIYLRNIINEFEEDVTIKYTYIKNQMGLIIKVIENEIKGGFKTRRIIKSKYYYR